MTRTDALSPPARRLLQAGTILFLLGLLTGFAIPLLTNPRMGLSSHLQGVTNGTLLLVFGLLWDHLALGRVGRGFAFGLALYGTFANWAATLLAGIWGAGRSMPIAAPEPIATPLQEGIVDFGLFSLSFSMLTVLGIVLWGLRRSATQPATPRIPRLRAAGAAAERTQTLRVRP
jgi:hydroxylaminobenzene mutase